FHLLPKSRFQFRGFSRVGGRRSPMNFCPRKSTPIPSSHAYLIILTHINVVCDDFASEQALLLGCSKDFGRKVLLRERETHHEQCSARGLRSQSSGKRRPALDPFSLRQIQQAVLNWPELNWTETDRSRLPSSSKRER